MKFSVSILFSIIIMSCNLNSSNSNPVQMKKQLNKDNKQVTVIVDVSYSIENINEIKSFIRDEQCPLFFNLEDSGIVRFEWFIDEQKNNATLIEVFENTNAWEEIGNKVLGSPINLRFKELFKIEKLTVLGEVNETFKAKINPMNPQIKTYVGGIN